MARKRYIEEGLITQGTLMTITSQRRLYRRMRSADLGAVDTSQQAFGGETTLPMGVELLKVSTQLKMQELFPEMVEGVQWDLFRNVLDFLVSIRVAELSKILDDENLPLTHGVNWYELSRKKKKKK